MREASSKALRMTAKVSFVMAAMMSSLPGK